MRVLLPGAQHRLHLTAFGAVRGGHLPEKVILSRRLSPVPAAGKPNRWTANDAIFYTEQIGMEFVYET